MLKKHQKTKKQHYVPKAHLKHFCEHNKTINVFDKEQLIKFKANINGIACANYFYDIEAETPEQEQIFEGLLSGFETIYGQLITDLLCKLDSILQKVTTGEIKNVEITLDEKQYLATFFVLQSLRTVHFRKTSAQILKHLLEHIASVQFKEKISIKVYEDKLVPIHLKHMFENLEPLAYYLTQQEWFIGISASERPFYTSDNPAILDREFCAKDGRGKGFISQGMNFYLPISSKYILYIIETGLYEQLKKPFGDSNIFVMQDASVLYANDLQLTGCLSQVYSSSDKYFYEDKKHCISKNICGNRNRPLFKTSIG